MILDVHPDGQRVVRVSDEDTKTLAMKETGEVLGTAVWLGKNFDVAGLIEVDIPWTEFSAEEMLE